MANMKILIRIVFAIFIVNVIDCLGDNNCCNFPKYKNISKGENNTKKVKITKKGNISPIVLVNVNWYNAKENKPILKIFEKEDDNGNVFISKDNKYKISIELDKDNNSKIASQNEVGDPLNLEGKKYAFFEIKTQKEEETVYLYCSDVESSKNNNGIFQFKNHKSISAIACDTEKVTNMGGMFYACYNLKEINFGNKINTEKVTNMNSMFCGCEDLKKLDIENFNTTNVTDMEGMFCNCSSLTELNLKNFNTKNVTNMKSMFSDCSSLKELNLQSFNTKNVTDMESMFCRCSNLKNLNLNNFNTTKVTDMNFMFYKCSNLKELDLKNFNTTNVTEKYNVFHECKNLKLSEEVEKKFLIKKK